MRASFPNRWSLTGIRSRESIYAKRLSVAKIGAIVSCCKGAVSGMAIGLMGAVTALLVPLFDRLWMLF